MVDNGKSCLGPANRLGHHVLLLLSAAGNHKTAKNTSELGPLPATALVLPRAPAEQKEEVRSIPHPRRAPSGGRTLALEPWPEQRLSTVLPGHIPPPPHLDAYRMWAGAAGVLEGLT